MIVIGIVTTVTIKALGFSNDRLGGEALIPTSFSDGCMPIGRAIKKLTHQIQTYVTI